MQTPVTSAKVRIPRGVVVGLTIGWLFIVAKCVVTPVLIARWQVPIDPGWVIVPTLLFAGLVSWLTLSHDWNRDEAD